MSDYQSEWPPEIKEQVAARIAHARKYWSDDSRQRAKAIGVYWRGIRREAGKTPEEAADATGVPFISYILFEEGLMAHEDLPRGYIISLATYLERPGAMEKHVMRFERDYLTDFIKDQEAKEL